MPVLLVIGSGPGISHATARRFGHEGYRIALMGRDRDRLDAGVKRLSTEGVTARAYVGDAADPDSARLVADAVHGDLGPITAVEISINGTIQGSPYATPTAIDPADVADQFWTMATSRTDTRVHIAEGS